MLYTSRSDAYASKVGQAGFEPASPAYEADENTRLLHRPELPVRIELTFLHYEGNVLPLYEGSSYSNHEVFLLMTSQKLESDITT